MGRNSASHSVLTLSTPIGRIGGIQKLTKVVTRMRKASLIFLLLIGIAVVTLPVAAHAQVAVGVSIRVGPPVLPVYVQPVCPGPGFIWTPGYWAYGPDGYYWVPGTWVEPPIVGVLWTPGYWGWRNGFYVWNAGYWGPHVGFYGGINYGFGYTGVGFVGGFWRGGVYSYNRAVTNVNTTIIHNTYNTTVINNTTINRTSFNGGTGGIQAQPNAQERAAMGEHHVAATSLQMQHEHAASTNRTLLASVNHGSPSIAASQRAGQFSGKGVVAANNGGNFQKFSANNNARGSGSTNNGGKGSFNQNANYKGGNNNSSTRFNQGNSGGSKGYQGNKTYTPNNNTKVASNTRGNSNTHNSGRSNDAHTNDRRDHR